MMTVSRRQVPGDSRESRQTAHLRLTLENEKCRSLKGLESGQLIKEVRCTRQVNQQELNEVLSHTEGNICPRETDMKLDLSCFRETFIL